MPIIHNESFRDDDPFQLRRFGYDMAGGPGVVVEHGAPQLYPIIPAILSDYAAKELAPHTPDLAGFLAYWTPERRARAVRGELTDN